jgi:hypothetical protein
VRGPGVWWGAALGAVILYTTASLTSFPSPLYFFPRIGAWGFSLVPGEPSIRWYGSMLDAAAGGVLGAVAGRYLHRRPPWAIIGWFATASLLALAWHERSWFLK